MPIKLWYLLKIKNKQLESGKNIKTYKNSNKHKLLII
jgi:hypothetical protein